MTTKENHKRTLPHYNTVECACELGRPFVSLKRYDLAATAALAPAWRSLGGCPVATAEIQPRVDNPASAACRATTPKEPRHAGDHARAFRHLGRRGVQREKDEVAKNLIKRVSKGRRVASEPASNQARSQADCSARGSWQSLMRVSAATWQCSRAPDRRRQGRPRAGLRPLASRGMHPIESAFSAGECRPQDRAGDESGIAQLGRLDQPLHPWG